MGFNWPFKGLTAVYKNLNLTRDFPQILWLSILVTFRVATHCHFSSGQLSGQSVYGSCAICVVCTCLALGASLTYLLAYSMVQSSSWEANWFAASQEIPRISRNPKVHYRTHKRPPPISILDPLNPVHNPTSHLLGIRPNIIHPSTPRSPQWSLSLRFPHQHPIHSPLLTHTRHMPSPSHSSRFYHPHNIGWGAQII